jgi:hypothetical protein
MTLPKSYREINSSLVIINDRTGTRPIDDDTQRYHHPGSCVSVLTPVSAYSLVVVMVRAQYHIHQYTRKPHLPLHSSLNGTWGAFQFFAPYVVRGVAESIGFRLAPPMRVAEPIRFSFPPT